MSDAPRSRYDDPADAVWEDYYELDPRDIEDTLDDHIEELPEHRHT